jgi:hypothetical protein
VVVAAIAAMVKTEQLARMEWTPTSIEETPAAMVAMATAWKTFHFWNLEQSSTEKAGIQRTYHAP